MNCRHYDREEINLVLDGETPPTVRCKNCGLYLVNGEWVESGTDNRRVQVADIKNEVGQSNRRVQVADIEDKTG